MTEIAVPDVEFLDFKVENGGCIESARLPLEDQGLVLVRGENLDDGGSNGSGKSTLFDLLSNAVTGTAGKGKTNTSKGISGNDFLPIWNPKGFHTELSFRVDSDEYVIHHYRKHKEGTRIEIRRNGLDITPTTTIGDVQKHVLEYTGLSEREWYGRVYLTQSYSHALVSGTPQQKKQYLSAHFGLDEADACISVTSKYINAIALPDMTSMKEMLKSCEEQLLLLPTQALLSQKHAELTARGNVITKKLVDVGVEIQGHERARNAEGERRVHVQKLAPLGFVMESDFPTAIAERTQRINAARQAAQAESTRESILRQLDTLPETEAPETLSIFLSDGSKRMSAIAATTPQVQRRRHLHSKLLTLPEVTSTLPEVTSTPEALSARVRAVSKQLSLSESNAQIKRSEVAVLRKLGDRCNSCLQDVPAERRDAMIAERLAEITSYDEIIPKSRTALEAAQNDLTIITERVRLMSEIEGLPDGDVEALTLEYTETRARVEALQTQLSQATSRKSLLTSLASIHVDADALADVVNTPTLMDEVTVLSAAKDFVLRYGNLRFSEDQLLLAMQLHTDLNTEHQTVASSLAEVTSSATSRRNLEAQQSQIQRQLSLHSQEANRKRVLEVLHVVLKDVKAKALRECTEMLRSSLPLYVRQLFPQGNISVELDESDDSLDFYLKKGQSHIPLVLASGGQQKRVGLAVLMAFAKLGTKTTNMLIADEPYKELDAVGRACAFELFQDLGIPSIYITSHDSDQQQVKKYDRVLTMRMQNGRSQLVDTTGT